MENYKILELILRLMYEGCIKQKRLPTLEEINKLLEAIQIVIGSSIKTSKEEV